MIGDEASSAHADSGPHFPSALHTIGEVDINVIDVGSGTPVLLLHGFPDRATMWRHQIAALVQAGHRVIAPDLRGFGDSSKPEGVENYAAPLVIGDILGLLDELGVEKVSIAAHDWGSLIAWLIAGTVPERVERLAVLSVGHPDALLGAGFEQKQLSWYVLWFQNEGIAEDQMSADDWVWYRNWIHDGKARTADHDLDRQLTDLERPGALTAGLNYYRANLPAAVFALDHVDFGMSTVDCPVLGIWSDGDPALTESQMTDSAKLVGGTWQFERLEGVDHWIPVHAAEATSRLLVDFFA